MLIIPAIDLIDGSAVRLVAGCFDAQTNYGDPLARIQSFARAGAEWVHVVDLDGAREKRPMQLDLIARLAASAPIRIQCGGGVRSARDVEALIDAGAARVVIGSLAVRNPDETRRIIEEFGADRIGCAFDARPANGGFQIAVDGWSAAAGVGLKDALTFYPEGTLRHALVTDISRDGALARPNVRLIADLAAARPDLQFQASGGVSSLEDLKLLARAGASAAIVGRALYEGAITLEDALDR